MDKESDTRFWNKHKIVRCIEIVGFILFFLIMYLFGDYLPRDRFSGTPTLFGAILIFIFAWGFHFLIEYILDKVISKEDGT